jgi:F-type H+-transporting ATPase subunit epsilon
MGELNVSLVAVDRKIWSGTASMVVAKTLEGEIGILPQHEPVLALLADSPVRITTTEGHVISAAVHGGFFSVDSDNVAILAESAELGGEIDVERARLALERAKEAGADSPDELAAISRAETRLKVAISDQSKAHAADTSGGHRVGG